MQRRRQKSVFEETGRSQHFRMAHARIVFDNIKQVREAWRLFRYLHGEETEEHLLWLVKFALHLAVEYSWPVTSNNLFVIYIFRGMIRTINVATAYEGCRVIEIVAKDAWQCVKFVGITLMHYGQLKAYGEGAQHVVIKVNMPGLSVHLMRGIPRLPSVASQ